MKAKEKPYSILWARILLYVLLFSYIGVIGYLLLSNSINYSNNYFLVYLAFIFIGISGFINWILVRYQNRRRKRDTESKQ